MQSVRVLSGNSSIPPKPALLLSANMLAVKKERSFLARLSLSQKSWKIAPPKAPFTVTWLPLKVDCTTHAARLGCGSQLWHGGRAHKSTGTLLLV